VNNLNPKRKIKSMILILGHHWLLLLKKVLQFKYYLMEVCNKP